MVEKRKILDEIKRHLRKNFGDSVKEVILFGSQTSGHAKEYSNYDILIILDKTYTGEDENRILDLCFDIDLKYDIVLDVHIISMKELNSLRGRQTIYINALKTGIYA
jgi:predicted nucleotidyltransferase